MGAREQRGGWSIAGRTPTGGVIRIAVLVVALGGCGQPGAATQSPSGSLGPQATPLSTPAPFPAELLGRTWVAEGPHGWVAGSIGGPTFRLGDGEIGIVASGSWIVSANLADRSVAILIARTPDGQIVSKAELHDLSPAAIAIVGDQAYVSGLGTASSKDPGIRTVDLRTGEVSTFIDGTGADGYRSVRATQDGKTVVSALCVAGFVEPRDCSLDVVDLATRAVRHVGRVAGGLVRATSSVAVLGLGSSDTAATELVGIDLGSGKELWRLSANEFHDGYLTAGGTLIQSRLDDGSGALRYVVAAIDLRAGETRTIVDEALSGEELWAELSTDKYAVIGPDDTIGSSLPLDGSSVYAAVIDIDSSERLPGLLPITGTRR